MRIYNICHSIEQFALIQVSNDYWHTGKNRHKKRKRETTSERERMRKMNRGGTNKDGYHVNRGLLSTRWEARDRRPQP